MADIVAATALAKQFDKRYTQQVESATTQRVISTETDTRKVDNARLLDQAAQARQRQQIEDQRRIDEDQRLRDQQQALDIRLADQQRLDRARADALALARQSDTTLPRGSVVDVLA